MNTEALRNTHEALKADLKAASEKYAESAKALGLTEDQISFEVFPLLDTIVVNGIAYQYGH